MKKTSKLKSFAKFTLGAVAFVTVASFFAIGVDSHFGFHRISRIADLKGQCFMFEKTEMSVNNIPLVGRAFQIDTDSKRFKYGYGTTLDIGLQMYLLESQLSKEYGVKQMDCEIYWNNAIKYTELKKERDESEKSSENR